MLDTQYEEVYLWPIIRFFCITICSLHIFELPDGDPLRNHFQENIILKTICRTNHGS
jgi:hypothetical protein